MYVKLIADVLGQPAAGPHQPFLINYSENYDHARFSAWLVRIIVAGLNRRRLTL